MERREVDDGRIIERQMGRRPRGVYEVVCRCRFGYPQVLRVHPVVDKAPFPTLYWLTCPFLVRAVSGLEAQGWISRLEREIRDDGRLQAAVERAHCEYVDSRNAMLGENDRREFVSRNAWSDLQTKGIGGIGDRRAVKCLHLHVAHALVAENPIGQRVLGALPGRECDAESVICSALE